MAGGMCVCGGGGSRLLGPNSSNVTQFSAKFLLNNSLAHPLGKIVGLPLFCFVSKAYLKPGRCYCIDQCYTSDKLC